ncbi:MAG: Mpo1-like protein [Planctomycetota bacterium]
MAVPSGPLTLREFWPIYLGEHRSPLNRALHAVGSLGGLCWLGAAIATRNPWLVLAGLVNGYAFAWVGHFFVEKNKPATFVHPGKSFVCDWIMLAKVLTFQIGKDLAALDAQAPAPATEEKVPV